MAKKKKKQGSGIKVPLPDVNDDIPFKQVAKEAKAQERKDTVAAIKYAIKMGDIEKAKHVQTIWNKLIDVAISYSADDKDIKNKSKQKLDIVPDSEQSEESTPKGELPSDEKSLEAIPGVDNDYF